MAVIQPDLTEAVDMSPIEEGTYKGKIVAAAPGTSGKGNPVIKLEIKLEVDGKPRTRKPSIPTSGAGAGTFEQLLRATGFDKLADQYKSGEKPPFDTDSLLNQELNVVITKQLYVEKDAGGNAIGAGEIRDNIKGYTRA